MAAKNRKSRKAQARVQRRRMVAALQSVGGLNGLTIALVTVLVVLVNLVSGELEAVLDSLVALGLKVLFPPGEWSFFGVNIPLGSLVLLIFWGLTFLVLIAVLRGVGKKFVSEERPRVIAESPRSATAIIMFLSIPNFKGPEAEEISSDTYKALVESLGKSIRLESCGLCRSAAAGAPTAVGNVWKMDNDAGASASEVERLEKFFTCRQFNWRMNIEALGPHMAKTSPLQHVVIVPSSDASTEGKIQKGSIEWLASAQRMIKQVLANNGMGSVTVSGLGELKSTTGRLPTSIFYYDLEAVVDALYEATSTLKRLHHCRERDILVDITSGTGLCNAAGLAFATLVEDRRVQYVDTQTYRVRTFDVTHDLEK